MGRQIELVEFLPQVNEGGGVHEMVVDRAYDLCVGVFGCVFEYLYGLYANFEEVFAGSEK